MVTSGRIHGIVLVSILIVAIIRRLVGDGKVVGIIVIIVISGIVLFGHLLIGRGLVVLAVIVVHLFFLLPTLLLILIARIAIALAAHDGRKWILTALLDFVISIFLTITNTIVVVVIIR